MCFYFDIIDYFMLISVEYEESFFFTLGPDLQQLYRQLGKREKSKSYVH